MRSQKNNSILQKIAVKAYQLFLEDFTGTIKQALTHAVDSFKSINGIQSVEPQHYWTAEVNNIHNQMHTVYTINIKISADGNETFYLKLVCVQGKNNKIEMITYFQDGPAILLESAIYESMNIKALMSGLKKELTNVKNFNQVLNIAKKYMTKGLTVFAIMSFLMCCYNFNELQKTRLAQELEYMNDPMNGSYLDKPEPEWQKICDSALVTVYNAVPEQTNEDSAHTASMFELDPDDPGEHKIIAMDRESMKKYRVTYGTLIKIEGTNGYDGVYQIQDTMNKRYNGLNRVDILVNNNIKFGKWNNVTLYKLINPGDCYDDVREKNKFLPAVNLNNIEERQRDKVIQLAENDWLR